jgi:sporulation protein YlmC with PRC-barrel domain
MDDTLNKSTDSEIISAEKVVGVAVFDLSGDKIGSIKEVYIDKYTGHTEFVSMAYHGGLFGMGEKYHPLPWSKLKYDTDLQGFVVDIDRQTLEGAPVYEDDRLKGGPMGWGEEVRGYYGGLSTPLYAPEVR